MTKKALQLTPEDWLVLGFETLIQKGHLALRAEALAKEIGATKGSFYWHFKDLDAFKARMIALWEEAARSAIDPESGLTPVDAITEIAISTSPFQTSTRKVLSSDNAMRAWAQGNDGARDALSRVDTLRLENLSENLRQIGITNSDFSRAIYGAIIGLNTLPDSNQESNADALSSILTAVVALAENS